MTRIERLSDAVVSLEVPRSFDDRLGMMSGFPAFGWGTTGPHAMPAIQAAPGLDAVETFDTVSSIQHSGIFVGVSVLSIVLAATLPPARIGPAGWVYFLIGPAAAFQWSR